MAEATIEQSRKTESTKRPSFEIDDRITLRLDPNLAIELGQFIMEAGTANKALWALAAKLKAVEGQFGE